MTDDRYVVSDERIAEIRKLIVVDDLDVIAVGSVGDLAAAVYDLLCERDDADEERRAEEANEAHLISRQEARNERREMEADEREVF